MPTPNETLILQAAQAIILGLNLPDFNQNVRIRKLPSVGDTLDPTQPDEALPMIIVCPAADKSPRQPLSFGTVARFDQTYHVEVVIVMAGNREREAGLDTLQLWRAALIAAFDPPRIASIPDLWNTEITPDFTFDRSKLSTNYDYSGIQVKFHCEEGG